VDWTTSKIESFHSADALRKLLSELDFGLGDDSWIEDDSHIFGTLYYRDISNVSSSFWHISISAHLDFEPVRLADSEGRRIYSEMNTGDCWWDTQDHFLPERRLCQSYVHPTRLT